MTTATKPATTIHEDYRHPRTLAGAGIRYFRHRTTGDHVVVMDLPAGEDIGPTVRRFRAVEEARVQWRKFREFLAAGGYERVL
jgi:hypothetical protein